ncbi:hypothetical protein HLB44_00225 [Aquincola sp. S2]|uniref:Uncharacterized protein n=2 Tax=Pseudaquabacterium terrae TaxID=2732868 RepID=A0ABX2EBZ9_9BURK|nr:hypothetical protein [Aquabacterium terrae]
MTTSAAAGTLPANAGLRCADSTRVAQPVDSTISAAASGQRTSLKEVPTWSKVLSFPRRFLRDLAHRRQQVFHHRALALVDLGGHQHAGVQRQAFTGRQSVERIET